MRAVLGPSVLDHAARQRDWLQRFAGACDLIVIGIPGPTHSHDGQAHDNPHTMRNGQRTGYPRLAARQSLELAALLHLQGQPVAVLPPQERPDMSFLRRMLAPAAGTSEHRLIEQAARLDGQTARKLLARTASIEWQRGLLRMADDLLLLRVAISSSSKWLANAATVTPSADAEDGRVHVTPANLYTHQHRRLETEQHARMLRAVLGGEAFVHHDPLPLEEHLSDEGAANHLRLGDPGQPGLEIFVYGRDAATDLRGRAFRGRQAREASAEIARRHRLPSERQLLVRQNPTAIDRGVFHSDVIAVSNRNVLFAHREAFADYQGVLRCMAQRVPGFTPVTVEPHELSLAEAVETYLFNSQLITRPGDQMALVAPRGCKGLPLIERILADTRNPIVEAHFLGVEESLLDGGGPACLRLRVPLQLDELAAVHPGVIFDEALHQALLSWIDAHYRETLDWRDLADPQLLDESRAALVAITALLDLPPLYPFMSP